ncbi:MAG: helix-turn-helix transcriptional regulator [Planctomycetaceae bacterium]
MKKKSPRSASARSEDGVGPVGGTRHAGQIDWTKLRRRVGRRPSPSITATRTLAGELQRLREEQGVSLVQLADRTGVAPATLIKFESRHQPISVEILAALAGELGYELTLTKRPST